jgi:hypothetical protein
LNETVDFSGAEIVDFSLNNFSCIPELKSKLVLLHGNPIDCAIETLEPFFGFSANRKDAKNLEFVCQTLLFWSFGVFDFEKRRASPFI